MKLKTEQEIRLSALHIYKYSTPETSKMFSVQDYCAGYTQAQQDIFSQASEGFEEALKSINVYEGYELAQKEMWQASSLANAKKMQEKDAEIKRLQKENQELREALKDIVDSYFDLPSELRMQKGIYECERSKRAREALNKIKEIEG